MAAGYLEEIDMINLGSKVRDEISGFKGVAVGRIDYMYGCSRIVIEPDELKDGKLLESATFDEQRIVEIEVAKPFIYPATNIKLGFHVRDTISGFSGVAHSRHVNMYGDSQFGVEPSKLVDGKLGDGWLFREQRLEIVEQKSPPISKQSSATSGGPQREFIAR